MKIKDNSDEYIQKLDAAIERGLMAIGLAAETNAKSDSEMPVDTGRARNSITFAMAGGEANTKTYKTNDGKESYNYSGKMDGKKGEFVAIGSNVEYFPFIENGSTRMRARHVLRRAATEHNAEYKKLLEDSIKNG